MWAYVIGQPSIGDYVFLAQVTPCVPDAQSIPERACLQARFAPYRDRSGEVVLRGELTSETGTLYEACGAGVVERIQDSAKQGESVVYVRFISDTEARTEIIAQLWRGRRQ